MDRRSKRGWRGRTGGRAALVVALAASMLVGREAAAEEAAGPERGVAERAREAYARRDFVAAARMYEALFADTGAVKYLFNAGMAREAAGNDGLAIRHWQRYLDEAEAIAAEERAQLTEQLAAARRRAVPVLLRGADERPITVELRYMTGEGSDALIIEVTGVAEVDLDPGAWTLRVSGAPTQTFTARPGGGRAPQEVLVAPAASRELAVPRSRPGEDRPRTITLRFSPTRATRRGISVAMQGAGARTERTVHTASARWSLAPGVWRLTARARGYLPRELEFGPEAPANVEVRLALDRHRRTWIAAAVAIGGVGLAAIVGGTAGTLRARRAYREVSAGLPGDGVALCEDEFRELRGLTGEQAIGTGFLAAGFGAAAAATTVAAGGGRRVLAAEAGVGATLLAVGAVGLPIALRAYDHDVKPTPERFAELRRPDLVLVATLSAGVGLLVGAVVGLVTRRPASERVRVTGGRSGVALAGRF